MTRKSNSSCDQVNFVQLTVTATINRPSMRPSVPSIDSSSDVQLVCCSSGAGSRYRLKAAGAYTGYRSTSAAGVRNNKQDSGQRHAVIRGMRVDADLFFY